VNLWVTFGDWRGNISDSELQRFTKQESHSYTSRIVEIEIGYFSKHGIIE
jgi:hypothetical protein